MYLERGLWRQKTPPSLIDISTGKMKFERKTEKTKRVSKSELGCGSEGKYNYCFYSLHPSVKKKRKRKTFRI